MTGIDHSWVVLDPILSFRVLSRDPALLYGVLGRDSTLLQGTAQQVTSLAVVRYVPSALGYLDPCHLLISLIGELLILHQSFDIGETEEREEVGFGESSWLGTRRVDQPREGTRWNQISCAERIDESVSAISVVT